jgi:hypothetical protein
MSRFARIVVAYPHAYGLLAVICPYCLRPHFHEQRETGRFADIRFAACRQKDLPKELRGQWQSLRYHLVMKKHHPRDPQVPCQVIAWPKKSVDTNVSTDRVTATRNEERSTVNERK